MSIIHKLTKTAAALAIAGAAILMPVAPSLAQAPVQVAAMQQTGTLQHSITISSNEIPMPLTSVSVQEGDTVLDVLKRSVAEHGISMQFRGGEKENAYVEGIDGVFEFDRGQGSGWMYSVNGIFPNRGAGVIKLVPGDVVEWKYTIDLGKDLNADLASFREDLEPKISVSGIRSGDQLDSDKISFQVEGKSYFGTQLQPEVRVNGQPTAVMGSTVHAILQPGSNTINMTVIDKENRTASEDIHVTYTPTAVNPNPSPTPNPNPSPNPNPNPEPVPQPDQKPADDYTEVIPEAISKAASNIVAGGVESEWQAIGLVKSGKAVPESYRKEFQSHLQDQVIKRSGTGRMKITDVERLAMTAAAIGIDPANADGKGFNLLEKIYNSEKHATGADSLTYQGNNGIIFALIALDTKDYAVPSDAKWSRDALLAELLKYQKDDGSWSLSTDKEGSTSYDITAMALTALAPYTDRMNVRQARDKAVNFLADAQGPTGGFDEAFVGGISSEATAQVIIGLTANGIDPRMPMFTKNGQNLIDHLLSFRMPDGGFQHTSGDRSSNAIATEQALQALVAYDLFSKEKGVLYDFKDVPVIPAPTPDPVPKPDPTPKPEPSVPQFTDITGHGSADDIMQAVEKGIFSGYSDGTFRPNQQLTRAQAVSILVRTLDLKTDKANPFGDTKNYANETQQQIAAAYHHGLVNGKDGKFLPAEHVTRSQMALMLYRAYEVKNGKAYQMNEVAPFRDIRQYNLEAIRAMTMLYDLNMAKGVDGNFLPGYSTTRAQAAKMIVQFSNQS